MNRRLASLWKFALAALRCVAFCVAAVVGFTCKLLVVAWCSLAIYFSNAPWPWLRVVLMIVFLALSAWLLWKLPGKRPLAWFAVACSVVLAWWSLIRPSHDRPWKTEVAVMPRAVIEGDQLRISNFRNFHYRTNDDFDVRYEECVFDLAAATGLPRETIRRKIARLTELGWVEKTDRAEVRITRKVGEHFVPDFNVKLLDQLLQTADRIRGLMAS